MGHLVTGVTVVGTLEGGGHPCGLTASAVASLSLRPPLVLACIDADARSHDCIAASGVFSLNILAADQERLSRHFASGELETKFDGIRWRTEASGAPVLEDALAWVDCRVEAVYPGGDHSIYVGHVLAGDAREGTPLLFYRGGYGRFMP